MILLVPLSFGFTYMMIKLAKHSEANAKLQPKKGAKSSISISQKWLYALFVVLLAFQVYLNIAAYYAMLQGMKNYSLFIVGIIMLVFAGMFHLYRYGRALAKAPPPKPAPPAAARPAPAAPKPAPAAPAPEKPLAAPPTAGAKVGSEHAPQLSQQQQKQAAGSTSGSPSKSAAALDQAQQPTRNTESSDTKNPKTI
jgi:ubiquinol-cytochrome c reductase cytochrome b subunit